MVGARVIDRDLDVEVIVMGDRIVLWRQQDAELATRGDRSLDREQQRIAGWIILLDVRLAAGLVGERHDVHRDAECVARQDVLGLAVDPDVGPPVDASELDAAYAGGMEVGAEVMQRSLAGSGCLSLRLYFSRALWYS